MPGRINDQMIPNNHARSVLTGMEGSSKFATAARTSGYGESSSAKNEFESVRQTEDGHARTEPCRIEVEVWIKEVGYRPDAMCRWRTERMLGVESGWRYSRA